MEAGRAFAVGDAAVAGSSSLLSWQSSIACAPAPRSETWCQAAALTCPLMMLCGLQRAADHLSDRLWRMGSSGLPRTATAAGTRRTRVLLVSAHARMAAPSSELAKRDTFSCSDKVVGYPRVGLGRMRTSVKSSVASKILHGLAPLSWCIIATVGLVSFHAALTVTE